MRKIKHKKKRKKEKRENTDLQDEVQKLHVRSPNARKGGWDRQHP